MLPRAVTQHEAIAAPTSFITDELHKRCRLTIALAVPSTGVFFSFARWILSHLATSEPTSARSTSSHLKAPAEIWAHSLCSTWAMGDSRSSGEERPAAQADLRPCWQKQEIARRTLQHVSMLFKSFQYICLNRRSHNMPQHATTIIPSETRCVTRCQNCQNNTT